MSVPADDPRGAPVNQTLTRTDPVPILGTNLAALVIHAQRPVGYDADGMPVLGAPLGATYDDLMAAYEQGWSRVTQLDARSESGPVFVYILRRGLV